MIAGFNVSLKWSYTYEPNDGPLGYIQFKRLENGQEKEIGKINANGVSTIRDPYNDHMAIAMANKTTPVLFIYMANRSDETKYCCKIKISPTDKETCTNLLILGKFNVLARFFCECVFMYVCM